MPHIQLYMYGWGIPLLSLRNTMTSFKRCYNNHDNLFFTQVNILEMSDEDHPSQEMVECLRQIGELSDKHSEVEKNVASVMESQQEIAGELAKVEQALPLKVSKEDLNIPDDLQDQLAMLKQGMGKFMSQQS